MVIREQGFGSKLKCSDHAFVDDLSVQMVMIGEY